jgi:hypothetical protein
MLDSAPANKGLLIAGAGLVLEGILLTTRGRRYVDFTERQGLVDAGKRLMRKLDVRSPAICAAVGLTELVWGLVLLRQAQEYSARHPLAG